MDGGGRLRYDGGHQETDQRCDERRTQMQELKYKSGSLRFADNQLLETTLGVKQGHLSLFAKINDPENKVKVIIDKRLMEAKTVSLHPLINTASTSISGEDFKYFADKFAPGYTVKEF